MIEDLSSTFQDENQDNDLFTAVLYELDTPVTQERPSLCDSAEEHQEAGQETIGLERIDAFSEPSYIQKVKICPQISLVETTKMLAEFYRSEMKAKEEIKVATPSPSGMSIEQCSPHSSVEGGNGGDKKEDSDSKKDQKGKKEQYPTKNFLPSFRSSFLNYLKPHFPGGEFESFQIIGRIKGKPCINMKDYEDLFREKRFRPILAIYFEEQVIVRDLMQSRIDYAIKCEYFKRIHVFEEAFDSGVFKRIN